MDSGIDHYNQLAGGSYDAGQSMHEESFRLCLSRFLFHCRKPPPATVLDLGCGTGRFCPDLASVFGGQVFGVEPSDSMRTYANTHRHHPRVTYLKGRAESIPLGPASCDLAILHEMVHHVDDRAGMAAELARVMRPRARLIVGTLTRDHAASPAWARFFPRAYELFRLKLPAIGELRTVLDSHGLDYVSHEFIDLNVAPNLKAYRERLSHLAIPALAQLSENELNTGFGLLESEILDQRTSGPIQARIVLFVAERRAH